MNKDITKAPGKFNLLDQESVTPIANLFRDKSVLQQKDFVQYNNKTTGMSTGYIAQEKATGNIFMLKKFHKDLHNSVRTTTMIQDRTDAVREFIVSDLFKSVLYDRAPQVQLVKGDQDHADSLYIRSKFFITTDKADIHNLDDFKKNRYVPSEIVGFEKAIAACNVFGDADYHGKNLMVISSDKPYIVKIDHGKALCSENQSTTALIKSLKWRFAKYNFEKAINDGELTFNIDTYSDNLSKIISIITHDMIDNIIDQRIDILKINGFDPNGFQDSHNDLQSNSFEELATKYKNIVKHQVRLMSKLSEGIAVISKYTNVNNKFKNQDWFKKITEDPVVYAIKNNIMIENINPLLWAHKNNYLVTTINEDSALMDHNNNSITENIFYTTEEPIIKIVQQLQKLQDPEKRFVDTTLTDFLNYARSNKLVNSHGISYDRLIQQNSLSPFLLEDKQRIEPILEQVKQISTKIKNTQLDSNTFITKTKSSSRHL